MVGVASLASVQHEFDDRVFAGTGQPRNGADGIALTEKVKDAGAIFGGQLVHEVTMPHHAYPVKHERQFKYLYSRKPVASLFSLPRSRTLLLSLALRSPCIERERPILGMSGTCPRVCLQYFDRQPS